MSLLERLQPFSKLFEPRVVQTLPKPPRDLDLDLLRFLPWIGRAEHGLKEIGVEHERFEVVSDGVNVDVLVNQLNGLRAKCMPQRRPVPVEGRTDS